MTKELFVSSTPHETRVGLVEDDLLAEVYLERENEYTLAGSIYKGRVTRVLPGMQSAFVDIGLERDAFLYVSDFMELQDEDEIEDIPTGRSVQTVSAPPEPPEPPEHPSEEPAPAAEQIEPVAAASENHPKANGESHAKPNGGGQQQEGRGNWRNRRRRGRRGMPDNRFARPSSEPRHERSDFGPPPGYQPILLPGESISKYQRMAQNQTPVSHESQTQAHEETPVTASFPEDEPLFAEGTAPGEQKREVEESPAVFAEPKDEQPQQELRARGAAANAEIGSPEWDREQRRLHEMNVAEVFGADETEEEVIGEDNKPFAESDQSPVAAAHRGTLEEEEIEEEEADLASYVEDLEEDIAFEEMEEETRHAEEGSRVTVEPQAAENGEAVIEAAGQSKESFSEESEEENDEDAEELELEEAQAEAEALLDAEARGNGTTDAQAEVRAASGNPSYTRRAQRQGFDRRGGPRGRRGGRRFRRRETQNVPLITDLLKEGQEILVQIAKEPIAKKGARITSHIALPGRFLVYMPTVHHTGVSRKISSEEERQRLKRIVLSERENGHGGFIVRTAAQGASEDELRADIRFLKGLWSEIKTRAEMGKAPTLIYHDLNVVERVLRDQVTSDFTAIWVDTEQEYERILRFANRFQPALVKRVKLYTKETPLFEQFGLTDELNKALKSKVWLKSGGYIVINQAEALVAIDVNTGKYVGKTARLEDTIVKTNVDAIKEIVRQVRLRDLGGIIIIDFIDMDERRNRQKVMQALEEALRSDRSPSKVLQFNDFGLVAITRKRVKQSLERTIGSPCPYCQSTGFVKSPTTVCNEIYVEMRKMAKHLEHSDVMLRVNPEVAKVLKSSNGRLLNEMEELIKKTVIVKSDPALHQEQFDIN